MKNVSSATLALLATRQYYSVNLFTFTLFDATVVRYTDADINIVSGGNTYLCGGFTGPFFNRNPDGGNRVQAHWKIGMDVDTIVFDVLPGSSTIEGVPFLQAIKAGYFDKAQCQVDRAIMPTYGDTSGGTIPIFLGLVGDVDTSKSEATFTINGGTILMNKPYPVDTFAPGCLNNLYDTNCTLSRGTFSATGTASSGSTPSVINSTSLSAATGVYDLGRIQFTSGPNQNFGRSIKTYVHGTPSVISLMSPFPFTPASSDAFTISQGCDKTQTTCNTKFSNLANYRGFDYIPDNATAV